MTTWEMYIYSSPVYLLQFLMSLSVLLAVVCNDPMPAWDSWGTRQSSVAPDRLTLQPQSVQSARTSKTIPSSVLGSVRKIGRGNSNYHLVPVAPSYLTYIEVTHNPHSWSCTSRCTVAQASAEFVTTPLQLERERAEGPLEGWGMYPLSRTDWRLGGVINRVLTAYCLQFVVHSQVHRTSRPPCIDVLLWNYQICHIQGVFHLQKKPLMSGKQNPQSGTF
ncbi:hypothetical protein GE21DRAFT_1270497 [Neurospora crassa]|nr:hypothetical protein GE21DRAFT_1270497 [Neurospora crassa]